ncbi:MAG: hypothetical protein EXR69_13605 [Myxococcales bacterium]|nr:hypothetical protein [Myxococcales bacterium]
MKRRERLAGEAVAEGAVLLRREGRVADAREPLGRGPGGRGGGGCVGGGGGVGRGRGLRWRCSGMTREGQLRSGGGR